MANWPPFISMTPTQWIRVKEVTADALEKEESSRADFIDAACGDEIEVRSEVLRLVAEAKISGIDFLSVPLFRIGRVLDLPVSPVPCFVPGETLGGRFRIDRFVNRGGMGEVYAALDLELKEAVALKTISPAIASAPDVIERFKREVKESRRISDPRICRVYDLFSHEQPGKEPIWFLTMELLEGHTLANRLASGAFPRNKAIALIRDLTSALSAAHDLGIVHRDFKPGNIMLVTDDRGLERAVVTDFGLAVRLAPGEAGRDGGAADGTPAYMAPEQATGGRAGCEADQFALGLVICELLTGSKPRLDRYSPAQSGQQLERWLRAQSRDKLTAPARATIRRCLAFRPENRFPHVRDAVPEIEGRRGRARRRWAATASVAIAAALAIAALASPDVGVQVKNATMLTPESGLSNTPAITRDGKWIVYSSDRAHPGNLDIWLQSAAGGTARRLTTNSAVENDPAISPDGKLIAFRSERNGGGLYAIGADGAGERLLVPGGWSPAFSPDGRWIAFWMGIRDDATPSGQLYVVPAEGGRPRRLAADFADARYPTWNSDGHFLLFDGCRENPAVLPNCTDWWFIRPDGTGAGNTGALALLKTQHIELPTPPQKAWRGDEIFFSGSRGSSVPLWTLKLQRKTLKAEGVPHRITPGEVGEREPAVSENGTVVFGRITAGLHIWRLSPKPGSGSADPVDAAPVTDDPSLDGCPGASRDGRWLYFTRKILGVRQLLVRDLNTGRDTVVFASDRDKFWPVSSPDGGRAVVEVRRETGSAIWLVKPGAEPRIVCSGCAHPTGWFMGSESVFYTTASGEIALLDLVTGASKVVLSPEPGWILGGADWNPQNQFLLFTAGKKSSAKQIFAVRFRAGTGVPSGPRFQLSHDDAEIDQPHWATDGKAFFFLSKRDASNCVWGSHFSASTGASDPPFAVMHYHDLRVAPDRASPLTRGLTVGGSAIFLSVGEVTDTLWLGKLSEPSFSTVLGALRERLSFWRSPAL